MTWTTSSASFRDFRRDLKRPNSLYLIGWLRGSRRALTATTLLEEVNQLVVEGRQGWRAWVFIEDRKIRSVPLRSARSLGAASRNVTRQPVTNEPCHLRSSKKNR